MGLADMLIKMGLTYGAKEAVDLCSQIGSAMANAAMCQSAILASDTEPFSAYNWEYISSSGYFNTVANVSTRDMVSRYGLRNSQLLTTAPTGTLSTMLGISGGIEPIFANYYTRTTKSLHNKDYTYKVYTPIVKKYMEMHSIEDDENLPEYFVTAQTLNYHNRIAMQSVWQTYIDASISSTVNVPNDFTVEQIEDLYIEAWKNGLKGITLFRDGCKRAAILNTSETKEEDGMLQITENTIPRGTIMTVPEDLTYKKYKLSTGCGKLYFFVGYDDNGVIYDCFTNTDGTGGCTINTQAVSRLLSACLRGGVPVQYIIEQLQKSGTCPSYQYARGKGKQLSKGSSCPSALGYVLKEILEDIKRENEEPIEETVVLVDQNKQVITVDNTAVCPDCGAELAYEGGCVICHSCGYSKCG